MISGLGLILLTFYFGGLILFAGSRKSQNYRWLVFNASIIISLFINVGNCIGSYSYSEVSLALCLLTCMISPVMYHGATLKIYKSVAISMFVLFEVLILGLINLAINPNMPLVLAMDTNMDQAYYGLASATQANLSIYNRISLMDISLFILVVACFKEELSDKQRVRELLGNIKTAFEIMFIVATFEFIVNNLVSSTMLRDIVIFLAGLSDMAKTFYPENRFGYCGITLLFSEQSYISVLLIYYAIVWVEGIKGKKDLFFYVLSMLVLLMSGCSTGVLLMPMAIFIFIRDCLLSEKMTFDKLLKYLLVIIMAGMTIYITLTNPVYLGEFFDQTLLKVTALFSGGLSSNPVIASGATRNFANNIAIRAFWESPLLGVGVGTTRGYGICAGLLANFGILGIVALIAFLNSIVGFSIKNRKILLIVLLIYFSIVLTVWYVYMLAFIPIYLIFSENATD